MKKNCHNCQNLVWAYGDANDPEGFICTRKDFFGNDEDKMINQMESKSYREKSKVCFKKKECANE